VNAATAVKRPEKITFAEVCSARPDRRPGLLFRLSVQPVSLDADRWGDEVRLSDIEGQFCFAKRAVTAVPTRDLTGNLGNGECPRPTSRQADKFSTVPNHPTMATSSLVR
jgi:hypothetical protein